MAGVEPRKAGPRRVGLGQGEIPPRRDGSPAGARAVRGAGVADGGNRPRARGAHGDAGKKHRGVRSARDGGLRAQRLLLADADPAGGSGGSLERAPGHRRARAAGGMARQPACSGAGSARRRAAAGGAGGRRDRARRGGPTRAGRGDRDGRGRGDLHADGVRDARSRPGFRGAARPGRGAVRSLRRTDAGDRRADRDRAGGRRRRRRRPAPAAESDQGQPLQADGAVAGGRAARYERAGPG